jgi:hypothetical protein
MNGHFDIHLRINIELQLYFKFTFKFNVVTMMINNVELSCPTNLGVTLSTLGPYTSASRPGLVVVNILLTFVLICMSMTELCGCRIIQQYSLTLL